MPLTIEVFIPASETTATLTAITGTGTAANPYTITQQNSSQFGTITVLDAANLLGLWQVKVGTRAIHRVNITAGVTSYPLPQLATAQDVADAQDALETAIDNIETGAITGDNEIAVTITDSDTSEPIEGAIVRYYRTGQAGGGTATVDADGEVIVGLNSATWKWIASADGYDSKTGTLVVSADGTHDIELDLSFAEVADAPRCNVVLPVTDQYLAPAPGVLVCIEFLQYLPAATKTAVLVNHPPSIPSDSAGLVEVILARQAKYRATYTVPGESPKRVEFTTPNAGSYIVVEA